MPKQLDPKIAEVLKAYGFGADACWDCHGTWVVYHKALEQIAAVAGIRFGPPMVVEADGANKIAAICVTGEMQDRSEWSIGEAAPGNNKNAYPWAMAEKRAKDRVILKLIGLHGLAYSEEEADAFKEPPKQPKRQGDLNGGEAWGGPLSKTEFQAAMRAFDSDLHACSDLDELNAFLMTTKELQEQCQRCAPDWWHTKPGSDIMGYEDRIKAVEDDIKKRGGVDSIPRNEQEWKEWGAKKFHPAVASCKTIGALDAVVVGAGDRLMALKATSTKYHDHLMGIVNTKYNELNTVIGAG